MVATPPARSSRPTTSKPGRWCVAAVTWWLLGASTAAGQPALPRAPDRPLAPSDDGRARVRGDRPQRASIHAAWSPPANEPDRDDRDALAAFESKELAAQTIVDVAPEPWMKKLAKPGLPLRWNRGLVEYLRYFTQDARGKAMM